MIYLPPTFLCITLKESNQIKHETEHQSKGNDPVPCFGENILKEFGIITSF